MRKKIKTVGYSLVFSTELSKNEIEEEIDNFLRKVDAKEQIAIVDELSQKEILGAISSF